MNQRGEADVDRFAAYERETASLPLLHGPIAARDAIGRSVGLQSKADGVECQDKSILDESVFGDAV